MVLVRYVLEAYWFFLPAVVANTIPILVSKINFLDYPVDFNKKIKDRRLFGDHKTWRGIFLGTLSAIILSLIQRKGPWLGIVLGGGSLIGDLLGSFIKRRCSLKPGEHNLLLDTVPFSIVGLTLAYIFNMLDITFSQAIFIVISSIPLSKALNLFWYSLKLKKESH